jgi:hypothetical protein
MLSGCLQEQDPGKALKPGSHRAGSLNSEAPPEARQFGQLAGAWDARQVLRNADGSWSCDTIHDDWIWRYTLDGHAIRDDWIVRPVSDSASSRFHDVNTRIYHPQDRQWHSA